MTHKKNKYTYFIIAIIAITLTVIAGIVMQANKQPTHNVLLADVPSAYEGLEFTLMSNEGKVSLTDFAGKWVLLYVGYTFCPDICPTNLGALSQAYQHLTDAEKAQVQILFVSVDPARDTPERLADYAQFFNMDMIGLTGDRSSLDALVKALGAAYVINDKTEGMGEFYSVDHSAYTYVISPQAKLIKQIAHGKDGQQFLQIIRGFIKKE